MKLRLIALLLCLAMVFSLTFSLVSCGGNGDENGDDTGEVGGNEGENGGNTGDGGSTGDGGDNGDGGADPEPEPEPEPLPPYTVVESYLPSELSTALYANFSEKNVANGFSALNKNNGPFAYTDIDTITSCKVKSITLPIIKVNKANDDGQHKFTIYKVSSSATGLMEEPLETYEILIDALAYGLPLVATNSLYKVIKLDLSSYDIVLGEGETLAFYSSTDTLVSVCLKAEENTSDFPMTNVFSSLYPRAIGVFMKVGSGISNLFKYDAYTLCFDFEFERTYENVEVYNAIAEAETQYQALVAALKQLYAGKKVSVLGDSISTYAGISNDGSANSTISSHGVYYPTWHYNFSSYTDTYWGGVIDTLDMDICVNNSWSGGRVYGGKDSNANTDRMPYRALELDKDDGTNPDVIIVYLGINDVIKKDDVPMGDLYDILADETDTRSDNDKIAAWFAAVLARAGSEPYNKANGGAGYTTFDQAYALSLYSMVNKYSAAEIYCMTLLFNYNATFKVERLDMANRVIMALATYFGATIIDQNGEYSEFTPDNVHAFGIGANGNATDCVHFGLAGHELTERLIIMTMAKKNGLI